MSVWVAVVGASQASAAELADAEEVGRLLGERGAVVVCGGRGGVMEAAARGAKGAGATTVGILPGPDRSQANPYVDIPVATGLGEARNAVVVRTVDTVVAVGGAWGTLSEIALALAADKPVFGLATWELGRAGEPVEGVVAVDSPAEAVDGALAGLS